jgi:hypothetical protein
MDFSKDEVGDFLLKMLKVLKETSQKCLVEEQFAGKLVPRGSGPVNLWNGGGCNRALPTA